MLCLRLCLLLLLLLVSSLLLLHNPQATKLRLLHRQTGASRMLWDRWHTWWQVGGTDTDVVFTRQCLLLTPVESETSTCCCAC